MCFLKDPCVVDTPCRNGATCNTSSVELDGYECFCPTGFSGENCTTLTTAWDGADGQVWVLIAGAGLLACYIGGYWYILRIFETEHKTRRATAWMATVAVVMVVLVCLALATVAAVHKDPCVPPAPPTPPPPSPAPHPAPRPAPDAGSGSWADDDELDTASLGTTSNLTWPGNTSLYVHGAACATCNGYYFPILNVRVPGSPPHVLTTIFYKYTDNITSIHRNDGVGMWEMGVVDSWAAYSGPSDGTSVPPVEGWRISDLTSATCGPLSQGGTPADFPLPILQYKPAGPQPEPHPPPGPPRPGFFPGREPEIEPETSSCRADLGAGRAFELYGAAAGMFTLNCLIACGFYIWNEGRFPDFATRGASRLQRGAGFALFALLLASVSLFVGERTNPDRLHPPRVDSVADTFVIYGWDAITFGVLLPFLPIAAVVSRMYLKEQKHRREYMKEQGEVDSTGPYGEITERSSRRSSMRGSMRSSMRGAPADVSAQVRKRSS